MTSNQISDGLKTLGINYSESAVRRAWKRDAPRTSIEAFAGWLALSSSSKTGASTAAAEAVGLSREHQDNAGGKLAVSSAHHGLAILADLFTQSGVKFWAAANPVVWMSFNAAAGYRPGDPRMDKVSGEFMVAAADAVNALGRMATTGMAVCINLERAGREVDASGWLAMAETPAGWKRLRQMAIESYAEFAALPDGDGPSAKPAKRKKNATPETPAAGEGERPATQA